MEGGQTKIVNKRKADQLGNDDLDDPNEKETKKPAADGKGPK